MYLCNILIRLIGKVLVSFVYLLVLLIVYALMFETVMTYHYYYKSYLLTLLLQGISLSLGFNVLFNFTVCTFGGPGNTKDL